MILTISLVRVSLVPQFVESLYSTTCFCRIAFIPLVTHLGDGDIGLNDMVEQWIVVGHRNGKSHSEMECKGSGKNETAAAGKTWRSIYVIICKLSRFVSPLYPFFPSRHYVFSHSYHFQIFLITSWQIFQAISVKSFVPTFGNTLHDVDTSCSVSK